MKIRVNRMAALMMAAGLGSCLVLTSACSRKFETHALSASDRPPTVAVVRVAAQPISRQVTLEAELEPYQEVDIRAKVAGYVRQINVDIGSRVARGQLLATLEVPELKSDRDQALATVKRREAEVSRAQEQLRLAQSAHQVAHLSYGRLTSVNQSHPGLVAEQEVDDAMGKDQQAEAQVSADRAALGAAQAALTEALGNQKRVQAMLDYSFITAPFSGVIAKRYVNTGTMVPAGTSSSTQATPVVTIEQNDPLRLVIYVPASLVPHVRMGELVKIQIPNTPKTFELPISRMADALDVASRTMRVEVDVPNPKMEFAPGEYANVELSFENKSAALVVPSIALVRKGNEAGLWLVNPEHRLVFRQVSVGIESSDKTEILSGVSENDLVAIGQTSTFQNGEKVSPKTIQLARNAGDR